MFLRKNKGFTLIELLVVIAIIGILASVVLASLNSARKKGRDARRVADIKQIQLALELYFDANKEYPDALSGKLNPTYLPAVPDDPLSGAYFYDAYTTSTNPPVAGDDCTEASEMCLSYHLGADLEENTNPALNADMDADGNTIDGPDADGCADAAGRYCYDVRP
ncbi:MAG: type II secretion system protein [Candidatus Niyogibacteria bacterium]|nr:type II secretion system protein [Candidatus Niyogibacteria bacterium]